MALKVFFVGLLLTLIFAPSTVYAGGAASGSRTEARIEFIADARTLGEISDVYVSVEIYEEYVPLAAFDEEPAIFFTTARVNLRPYPSTNNTRIRLVNAGRRVEVVDFRDGEWFEVRYGGEYGFMYAAHLRESASGSGAVTGVVELVEWRDARGLMRIGTHFTVIDVRTGLTWQMASFSNGNHSDVETITAEDTATMLQAFGGRWTWTPRPIVVVIDGRYLAASINGMPHAGSTRNGNNMNGHVCIHFRGSTTHTTAPQHTRDHQNAVTEAYNTASQW